ncbi:hypothetical protein [Aurantiacibacter zhengii]|uniref:Uncharacterized protein n=1 Tax=Aurantiacibacter zhengii TaxID=2307003 RepID=A0A418NP55_9SPHN|nr:hypothetical protein [Aurantiacibacter zhengii]RIV83940.1 hypothetical protein D2V07_15830 [Aurantiacibacter zhengii]
MRKTLPALIAATLCVSGCTTGVGGNPLGGLLGGILGGNGYNERNLSDFERAAVNACGQEAQRYTRDRVRVERVDQITRDSVRVDGRIETRDRSRDEFTCTFASNGRIADFRVL